MELDKNEIAQGRTREEIQQREKIIKNFYVAWNASNPEKRVYNINSSFPPSFKPCKIQDSSFIKYRYTVV